MSSFTEAWPSTSFLFPSYMHRSINLRRDKAEREGRRGLRRVMVRLLDLAVLGVDGVRIGQYQISLSIEASQYQGEGFLWAGLGVTRRTSTESTTNLSIDGN